MKYKRNFIAKDLYTPKYKNRVISMAKIYNRKKIKKIDLRNLDC